MNTGVLEHYCRACVNFFEVSKPMGDIDLPADCPQCGKPAGRRRFAFAHRSATPFTVVNSDGIVVHQQPDGGNIVPPVEDIARKEKKEM